MKKYIIFLIVYFTILIVINIFVMPNHEYWKEHLTTHVELVKIVLFLDVISLCMVLPNVILRKKVL